MPQRPSSRSPSASRRLFRSAPLRSALLPWRTDLWQGDCRSVPAGKPVFCIRCNVGEVGFPPLEWPRCLGHAGAGSAPALLSSSPLGPGIPPPGSSAGLPWTVTPFKMSLARPPWTGLSNSVAPLTPAHAESPGDTPEIPPPSPPCTPCSEPVLSGATCRWVPTPLSVSRTPPPTDYLPPGRGGRPCRLSYQHWYVGPPYQTVLPGRWMHRGASGGQTRQPCHRLRRRGQSGAYLPVHAWPAPPRLISPPPPSFAPPHPPQH